MNGLWFSARAILLCGNSEDGQQLYEERIILCSANSEEQASRKAFMEFEKFAEKFGYELLPDIQLFAIENESNSIEDGVEVFSLLRKSSLRKDEYFERFFDTGQECQRR